MDFKTRSSELIDFYKVPKLIKVNDSDREYHHVPEFATHDKSHKNHHEFKKILPKNILNVVPIKEMSIKKIHPESVSQKTEQKNKLNNVEFESRSTDGRIPIPILEQERKTLIIKH